MMGPTENQAPAPQKQIQQEDTRQEQKKKITSKQVVALGGVILLVLLYVVTLIVSIVDRSASRQLFAMCLFATIAVPILIWIYVWMYGKLTGRKTIADFRQEDDSPDVFSDPHS